MKNILTIYKFNFPFFESTYENMKSKAIISDIKELLLYNDVEFENSKDIKGEYIITTLTFKGGSIRIIFHDNDENYFIPKFQFDLYFDGIFNEKLYIEIIKIFESIGLKEYIFSFDILPTFIDQFDILTLKYLENNFKNYDYKKLKIFIESTQTRYIDDVLKEDNTIRNGFYYMIFICYIFYTNIRNSESEIEKINKFSKENIFDIYKENLYLGKTRLEELENISLANFRKYKDMLDELFELIN